MSLSCPYCSAEYKQAFAADELNLAACQECMNPFAIEPTAGIAASRVLPGHADLRQSVPAESLGGRTVTAVHKNLENLPVSPAIALEVTEICNDPNSSIQDLARRIAQDPAMAGKLLQVANSAFYGGLKSITSLDAACARLGMANTARIAQSLASARMFTSNDPAMNAAMQNLWRHSLVTAQAAHEVALLVSDPQPETLYLTALFHEIGSVAIIDRIAREKDPALAHLRSTPELLHEILDGFGKLVGLHTIQAWGLPAPFRVAAYYASQPAAALEPWLRSAHITAIASALADAAGYPADDRAQGESGLVGLPSASFLGLTDIKVAGLRVDLEDKLDEWVQLLSN